MCSSTAPPRRSPRSSRSSPRPMSRSPTSRTRSPHAARSGTRARSTPLTSTAPLHAGGADRRRLRRGHGGQQPRHGFRPDAPLEQLDLLAAAHIAAVGAGRSLEETGLDLTLATAAPEGRHLRPLLATGSRNQRRHHRSGARWRRRVRWFRADRRDLVGLGGDAPGCRRRGMVRPARHAPAAGVQSHTGSNPGDGMEGARCSPPGCWRWD